MPQGLSAHPPTAYPGPARPQAHTTATGHVPAPRPGLFAGRHLLAGGQPAEDGRHGSQPGVSTGQAVRNGAQGLRL
jgi:hypothetical protein